MKILRVGDPHITVKNLEDASKLIDFIILTAKRNSVDRVEFMGDLFHTHAVVRVEVMDFWKKSFKKITESGFPVLTLVGNHDQPGSREKEDLSALDVFEDLTDITVVNKPKIFDNILYVPYMSDGAKFVETVNRLHKENGVKALVAHQTFTGATYENGFYAKDGIDLELIPFEHIICGHIHKEQKIGPCHYIGTPKWDGMADANQDKGIWVYTHDETGSVVHKGFVSTREVVTPIYKFALEEGRDIHEIPDNARVFIELRGTTAWINKMKKKYKGRAQLKAIPTDKRKPRVELSEGVGLSEYLDKHFKPIEGVSRESIQSYLKELSNE